MQTLPAQLAAVPRTPALCSMQSMSHSMPHDAHPSKVTRSPTGTPSGGLMGLTSVCSALEAQSTCVRAVHA